MTEDGPHMLVMSDPDLAEWSARVWRFLADEGHAEHGGWSADDGELECICGAHWDLATFPPGLEATE